LGFPEHIDRIFDAFGIAADTKATLYDLYVSMGPEVLEVFSDIAEGVAAPSSLRPEDCADLRQRVVERYLRRNHPLWLEGTPTPSLYRPRAAQGRAAGLAIPLGTVAPGIIVQGREAHSGGRDATISFDFVAADLDDALLLGLAAGQQHTIPGSVGETSGTADSDHQVALLWEIQPNVFKPTGKRNRSIAKIYRRHRDWHVITLTAALEWLRAKSFRIYVVRGEALAPTHEVNRAKPVSPTIVALHNRTVENAARELGLALHEATRDDEQVLLNASVMNVALRKHVVAFGAGDAIWRIG
jgi:hypothetical protein